MSDRDVTVTWKFKIDGECDKTYPAILVDMLLRDRKDLHLRSWGVTDLKELGEQ